MTARERVTFQLPAGLKGQLDTRVDAGEWGSISDACRDALADLLRTPPAGAVRSDGGREPVDHTSKAFLCKSCGQLFPDSRAWMDHADGPFADVLDAENAMVEIGPGDEIPEGATLGVGKCDYPEPPAYAGGSDHE